MTQLTINLTDVYAEVYKYNEDKQIFYIKLNFPSLGLYINRISVRPSAKFDGLWVQNPKFFIGRGWVSPIEFRNDCPLKELFEEHALLAVDAYNAKHKNAGLMNTADYEKALSEAVDSVR